MKKIKYGYWAAGLFAAVGAVLYIIVICEALFNKSVSPDWVSTVKIWGLVAFCVALIALVLTVILAIVLEKKQANKPQVSDEELLEKYKSNKSKK